MKSLYSIISKKNNRNLDLFKETILKELNKKYNIPNNSLSNIHKVIKYNDINKERLNLFNLINTKLNWENLILNLCEDELITLLGPDILVQTKINLSIQMPEDPSSVLSFHSDCGSGDTPFQINLWIPLTDCESTNSMFILSDKETFNYLNSKKINDKKNFKIKKDHYVKMKYGEILFFNPAVFHGNTKNETKKTRVSLNVRLKSLFSPDAKDENPDRKLGSYYKILKISENTKFSLNFLESSFYE